MKAEPKNEELLLGKKVCPACNGSKKVTLGFPGWHMGEEPCIQCDDDGLVSK
jgi:hypothetical protein